MVALNRLDRLNLNNSQFKDIYPYPLASHDFDQQWVYRPDSLDIYGAKSYTQCVARGPDYFVNWSGAFVYMSIFIGQNELLPYYGFYVFGPGISRKRGPHRRFSNFRPKKAFELTHRDGH